MILEQSSRISNENPNSLLMFISDDNEPSAKIFNIPNDQQTT